VDSNRLPRPVGLCDNFLVWYPAVRRALFALDPEAAHALTLDALRIAGAAGCSVRESGSVDSMGLHFANPVGLAAGFDKNGVAVDGIGRLGFGFIEIGTVTPRAQPGQPRPRVFRLPAAGALINRLGFPSEGAEIVAARLRRHRFRGIVGVNIGKNADTPNERAIDDYMQAFRVLRSVADYIAVNVSSPNTPALRALQARERLGPLLSALLDERSTASPSKPLPILVKISPDLDRPELTDLAGLLKSLSIDGVIATNTTVERPSTLNDVHRAALGGLSGRPLHAGALRTVSALRKMLGPKYPIIGVGGVDSAESAEAMRAAGANLIQLYTGLVYRGPAVVAECVRALGKTGAASKAKPVSP
jgi:dihydroorotate dehydrogenase